MHIPFEIILRTAVIYFFIIAALRIFGKREVAQLSTFDLVFVLLISNSVQNAMVGPDNSLIGGIIAALTLFTINYAFEKLLVKSERASNLLQGETIMLIYHGRVLQKHLDLANISRAELDEAIREHGVEDTTKVDLAVLETDGNISVLSGNFQHKTIKRRKARRILETQS